LTEYRPADAGIMSKEVSNKKISVLDRSGVADFMMYPLIVVSID